MHRARSGPSTSANRSEANATPGDDTIGAVRITDDDGQHHEREALSVR